MHHNLSCHSFWCSTHFHCHGLGISHFFFQWRVVSRNSGLVSVYSSWNFIPRKKVYATCPPKNKMHCTNHSWASPRASTVCLVFPPFSSPYPYGHLYYSPTNSHATDFLSLLLSSLWSSFWEAVCPDTLVIMLMSLKLWSTPAKITCTCLLFL